MENLINYDEYLFEDVLDSENDYAINEAGLRKSAMAKKQTSMSNEIISATMKDPKIAAVTAKYLSLLKKAFVRNAKEKGVNPKFLKGIKVVSLKLNKEY